MTIEVEKKRIDQLKIGVVVCVILTAMLVVSNTLLFIKIESLRSQINNLELAKTWHVVAGFNGTNQTTTSLFDIAGDVWRVTWTANASNSEDAFFDIMIYPKGETVKSIALIIIYSNEFKLINPQYGVEYLAGRGSFYIKVFAENLEDWSILVESYY